MTLDPQLLQLRPLARRLGVDPAWLAAEADAGRVPCLRAGDRYLFDPAAVEAILLARARVPVIRISDCIDGLRSADPAVRIRAGLLLAKSLGAGLALEGADPSEAELGIGRDLAGLLGRAMAGDRAAADELARGVAAWSPAPALAEPSGAARALARTSDAIELIDKIEAEADGVRRSVLVEALVLHVAARGRSSASARAHCDEFMRACDRMLAGDAEGIEAARAWVVQHVIAPASAEGEGQ